MRNSCLYQSTSTNHGWKYACEITEKDMLVSYNNEYTQVNSIENTRMKYYGSDFKMTSQANHLSKLMNLLETAKTESFHMQRLYKRRRLDDKGYYHSNWTVLRERSALDANGYYPPR